MCRSVASGSVRANPQGVLVHPGLQKFFAIRVGDVAGTVKQTVLYLNEHFRLAERGYVQIGKHIAQVLWPNGGANGTDRTAQHSGRLARPSTLAIRARSVVDGILEHAR